MTEGVAKRPVVGVIGTGNMGSALVRGWVRPPEPELDFVVWDKVQASLERLLVIGTVVAAPSLDDLVKTADVVLVVVKPKDAGAVLGAVAGRLREGQTVISAMAGVTLESIRTIIGPAARLFRVMPNLGVELGVGAVAIATEPGASAAETQAMVRLFEPLGLACLVPEEMLDAVTAVSGSGPAFLALAVEGLEDGAVAAGLSRPLARALVRQAALLAATGELDPSDVATLEDRGVRSAFQDAVQAAVKRSRELS